MPILQDPTFLAWISKRYAISSVDGIMKDEVSEEDIESAYEGIAEA